MTNHDTDHINKVPKGTKTIVGLASAITATCIVHPLDMLKVRMQVHPDSKSTIQTARSIVHNEGFKGLYIGLNAGIMRQFTNTAVRLACIYTLSEKYKKMYERMPSLYDTVIIGVVSGLLGAFSGNPSEVVLVRMMGDGTRQKPGKCVRYKSVNHAVVKIAKTEGIVGLWRGGLLTLARSLVVSCIQITSVKQTSDALKNISNIEGMRIHLYTASISSFLTAVFTLPIDLVKTRYQYKPTSQTQCEVFSNIIQTKGVRYLWKGFMPYYTRLFIHTSITCVMLDVFCMYYVNVL